MVPANLRALRMECVCDRFACRQGCSCLPSQRTRDLTLCLHAGLERLCLVLWRVRMGLQYLSSSAPVGLRELNVQARAVDMDAVLAAEVAQRGRVLERCDVYERTSGQGTGVDAPTVQVVAIGRGLVHFDLENSGGQLPAGAWPCTCGACAACLGPQTFG